MADGAAAAPAERGAAYLDHAATTPMRRVAAEAMAEAFARVGNPASLHGSGRAARRRVEEAREALAAVLGARPSEVLFTAGGTESDNLAVKGIFRARRDAEPARRRILAGAAEHHAVLDAVEWLAAHEGAEVTWLAVDDEGRVLPQVLREALAVYADETALVSVMWANNEVGTVNPIRELASVADGFGVPLHTDAIQAVGHVPVDFTIPGLSALSIAAHKFGGPQGTGALLLRRDVACVPLLHGGGHEREVRSGTVDVAGAAGMAAAAAEAERTLASESRRVGGLRDALVAGVRERIPDVLVNGARGADDLPTIAHLTFPGCEGDSLLMLLDAAGIECSTGSACTAGVPQASHVLIGMGMDPSTARGSLRFSLGYTSTAAEVDRLLETLPAVVDRARAAGMADGHRRRGTETASERRESVR
ncbi:cysteine desulfurase family protein [Tomitella fengzijianii]|uniref:cysteine desulfurase family protein n=1 Tax=Tomitella fengzijianii TaxID=2597660 RepID=UPI0022A67520|nr:cysteine desulfurase family protein [Tomitella fengzijianii]